MVLPLPLKFPFCEVQTVCRPRNEPPHLLGALPSFKPARRGNRRRPDDPALSPRVFRLTYETNYINLFRPETRVVRALHQALLRPHSELSGLLRL